MECSQLFPLSLAESPIPHDSYTGPTTQKLGPSSFFLQAEKLVRSSLIPCYCLCSYLSIAEVVLGCRSCTLAHWKTTHWQKARSAKRTCCTERDHLHQEEADTPAGNISKIHQQIKYPCPCEDFPSTLSVLWITCSFPQSDGGTFLRKLKPKAK